MRFRATVELGGTIATGIEVPAGEDVDVEIVADDAPREVALPSDLDGALTGPARAACDGLSYSHRKEWVRWVEEARKPETRTARIERTVADLAAGKKTH